MKEPRKLLWVDGLGAAGAGAVVLLAGDWLSPWYRLPAELLVFIGVANLAYASYSLSLAKRVWRPKILIRLLVVANLIWAAACFRWAYIFGGSASLFGLAHLVIEGLYVAGLASLEWRWREQL